MKYVQEWPCNFILIIGNIRKITASTRLCRSHWLRPSVCACECVCVSVCICEKDMCVSTGSINLAMTIFSSQQPYLYFYFTQSLLVIFPFCLKITIPRSAKHRLSIPFLVVKSFWHSGRWTFCNNNGAGLFWLIGNLRRENVLTQESDKTELNGSEWWGQWLVWSVPSLSYGFIECKTHIWMLAPERKPSYER